MFLLHLAAIATSVEAANPLDLAQCASILETLMISNFRLINVLQPRPAAGYAGTHLDVLNAFFVSKLTVGNPFVCPVAVAGPALEAIDCYLVGLFH